MNITKELTSRIFAYHNSIFEYRDHCLYSMYSVVFYTAAYIEDKIVSRQQFVSMMFYDSMEI